MPKKKESKRASLARQAWKNTKGVTSSSFDEAAVAGSDPDRAELTDFVGRWQYRLTAFAVEFARLVQETGTPIEEL